MDHLGMARASCYFPVEVQLKSSPQTGVKHE